MTPLQALKQSIEKVRIVARQKGRPFENLLDLLIVGEEQESTSALTPLEQDLRELTNLAVTLRQDGQVNEHFDHSGEAKREQNLQRRVLETFYRVGERGEKLYVIYKNLHIPAKQARQTVEELVKAGWLEPMMLERSEAYRHKDFISH